MRIALASRNHRRVGGAENYLDAVIPALARAGHELAHLCELDLPADRAAIALPADAPVWRGSELSTARMLDELARWQPAVIFSHGLGDIALEAALPEIAPVIFYAHDYYGACISGTKCFAFPRSRPCSRSFDWRCLVRYYPRRCGGLNPATLWQLYRRERRHLVLLRACARIAVGSRHLRGELLRQGLAPDKVRILRQPVVAPGDGGIGAETAPVDGEWRLLFAGRMVELKGGELLLRALPLAARALRRPIRLLMAGDGPARARWHDHALRLAGCGEAITVEFPGWLDERTLADALAQSHLLVMPSVWPEPFGRVGPEAAMAGVPVVAFAVGGVPEWLIDGVNGHLAPGDPPTVSGLADAIVRSLGDPAHRAELARQARARADEATLAGHVEQLAALFEEACAASPRPRDTRCERVAATGGAR